MCYTFVPAIMYYIPYLIESLHHFSEVGIIPILYLMKLWITMVMNPR